MSNRPSICWSCKHREHCTLFNKDPETEVIDCGRFIMRDVDKAIVQAIHEHFMAESELEDCNNTELNCVLGKIRAEFEELRHYYPMGHDYQIAITRCLAVIDKYKADPQESEEV